MRILALDLGKSKSVACVYETSGEGGGAHRFETVATMPRRARRRQREKEEQAEEEGEEEGEEEAKERIWARKAADATEQQSPL
jgi:hypothetical protein